MKQKVYVSSLTVGRCFTVAPEGDDGFESSGATASKQVRTIMSADKVWKVTGVADDEVQAVNAAGAQDSFGAKLLVLEVSREGFDRLADG